jgi:signal peptidase I
MKTPAVAHLFRRLAVVAFLTLSAVTATAMPASLRKGAAARAIGPVALPVAVADANLLAAKKGDRVVRVEGTSMLPYFGDGAVLVVRKGAVENLREGMVVLYRNRFSELVAHRIEVRSGDGWTVRGANNAGADSTLVTAENLLGTVYATFYSDAKPVAGAVKAEVALAAAAR